MNHELAKTLTTALVQFIDRERPEGTMDCSNGECVSLEKAFTDENFDSVETLIKKKLTGLTEFEKTFLERVFHQKPEDLDEENKEIFREDARFVFALAREQLIKDGYVIEKKAFHEAVKKVSPEVMKEVSDNVDKMEEELTEFEDKLVSFALQCGGQWDTANEEAKKWSNEFLAIARRELLSYADESNPAIEAMADLERTYFCNPDKLPKWLKSDIARKELNAHTKGYNKGYKDAEKQYNESVAYHFPIMPTPPSGWGCDGTHCTNPHHDCINCPFQYSSGGTITTPNTASGTSTATLHGNTSATDGKDHNPSFTD